MHEKVGTDTGASWTRHRPDQANMREGNLNQATGRKESRRHGNRQEIQYVEQR
jgi:hypothetical protein